ncbi:MAG: hypothetical protein ACI9OU_001692 [Candidatus Promineifilaceae bacterium]|jgi:hypothetical protein
MNNYLFVVRMGQDAMVEHGLRGCYPSAPEHVVRKEKYAAVISCRGYERANLCGTVSEGCFFRAFESRR